MKILKRIGIALLAIVLLVVVVSFFLPSKAHVERSTVINAAPEIIFEQVNVLKNWANWSPWDKMDPAMEKTFEGPESGVGNAYSWKSSNKNVGSGKMSITESIPNESIKTSMNFMENGVASGGFKFEKGDGGEKLTWYMDCDMGMNPMGKIFGFFFMDKMLGADFENGLANLKEVAENVVPATPVNAEVTAADSTNKE